MSNGKMDLMDQFRSLARAMRTIEHCVLSAPVTMPGMPVRSVAEFCARLGVTAVGAEVLAIMIEQSEVIKLSPCKNWLVPITHTGTVSGEGGAAIGENDN